MNAEPYRMVEPQTFHMTELEAVGALDAVYADDYEPQFPSPGEILILCAVMPCVGLVKLCRWTFTTTVNLGPVVPAVAFLVLAALSIFFTF